MTNRRFYTYHVLAYVAASILASIVQAVFWSWLQSFRTFIVLFSWFLILDLPPTALVSLAAAPIVRRRFLTLSQEMNKGYAEGILIKLLSGLLTLSLFVLVAGYRFQDIDSFRIFFLSIRFVPFFILALAAGAVVGGGINEFQK